MVASAAAVLGSSLRADRWTDERPLVLAGDRLVDLIPPEGIEEAFDDRIEPGNSC